MDAIYRGALQTSFPDRRASAIGTFAFALFADARLTAVHKKIGRKLFRNFCHG